AHRAHDLDRLGAEAAGAAPHEHGVARANGVRRPGHEHAIGRRADQHVGGRGLPGEVLRLRQALVLLHAGELGEAPPVGLVAPDPEARAEHRIPARPHDRVVGGPRAAVDDDVVAHVDVADVATDLPHDARGIAAAEVERAVVGVILAGLADVDRVVVRCPGDVVVDVRLYPLYQSPTGPYM